MKKLLTILFIILSVTVIGQNTRFNFRSDIKVGDSATGLSPWAVKYASPFWVYTYFLMKSDTALTVATKYDLDTLAANIVYDETDPIFALDSAAILHWYDSIVKIATKYDIDTLTFLRSFTESDPIFALDSAAILHWYDSIAKMATKYDIDTLTFLRSESDPIFANDSANLVHWTDTLVKVATKYDLDTLTVGGSTSVDSLAWVKGTANVYLRDATDKVGIGTALPDSTVTVIGSLRASTNIKADKVNAVTSMTAPSFIGAASQVAVGSVSTNADYYPTYVTSGIGNKQVYGISTMTFNPVTGVFTIPKLSIPSLTLQDTALYLMGYTPVTGVTKAMAGTAGYSMRYISGKWRAWPDSVGAGGSGVPTDSLAWKKGTNTYQRDTTDKVTIGKTIATSAKLAVYGHKSTDDLLYLRNDQQANSLLDSSFVVDKTGQATQQNSDVINTRKLQNTNAGDASYYFDGSNDYVSLGTSTQLDLGTGDGTYFVRFRNTGNDGANNVIYSVADGTTNDNQYLYITTTGKLSGLITDNTTQKPITGVTDIGADSKIHSAAFTIQRESTTGLNLYLDGNLDAIPATSVGISGSIASTGTKRIGIDIDAASSPFSGNIYNFKYFNCALSADEIKELSEGGSVPYKYVGASNTALTSGTLVVGKQYLIKTYVSNDDFTNVGAASNAAGVVFVATGTTPTHWAHSSNLIAQGEILSLNPAGMSSATWFDQSGNAVNGTVSGALLNNRAVATNVNNLYASGVGVNTDTYDGTVSILKASTYNDELAGGLCIKAGALDTKLILGATTGTYGYIQAMQKATSWTSRNISLQPNGGNVGIGTTAPDEKLVVVGASTTGKYTSSGWTHSSDSTMKDSIRELVNPLGKLRKLHGVKFIWKSDTARYIAHVDTTGYTTSIRKDTVWMDSTYTTGTATGTTTVTVKVVKEIKNVTDTTYQTTTTQIKDPTWKRRRQNGFLAQEVKGQIPEAVVQGNDGKLSLADNQILPIVVEGVKVLADNIDSLNYLAHSTQIITPDSTGIKRSMLAKTMYVSLTAPVTLRTGSQQIVNGWDGQEITLVGTHNSNNITLHDGDNVQLSTATIQLKKYQTLTLIYAAPLKTWIEKSRSLN